jgi:uncharacterized SAM-binding protein YcdF (DUF218 family)
MLHSDYVFVAGKIDWFIVRPSSALILLATAGLAFLLLRRERAGRWALAVGIGGLLAVLILPVDRWVLLPLEDRFPRPAPPAHVDGIIGIGGAIDEFISADRGIPSLNDAAERMTEFVALARRYPDARLVFSGGSGAIFPSGLREAEVARAIFASLGLDTERMDFEGESRTTWENAIFAKRIAHPAAGEIWLLITSASHMPRAVGVFRRAGWDVLAWPVAYKSRHTGGLFANGSFGARISALDLAVHEWIGLLAYHLTGKTDALFPGP